MIAAPPVDAGAAHETTDCAFAFDVAVTNVGAPAAVAGTAAADATDARPEPAEFVAITTNVYEVPLVRPVTVHELAGATALQASEPGEDVTV